MGPVRVRKSPAVVNTHPGFVRMKILLLDETHVIARDDRYGLLACQQQTRLYAAFFVAAAGPGEFQVIAVVEYVTPGDEPLPRFIQVPDEQRMADVAVQPSRQCDEAFTAIPVQPLASDHRLTANPALEVRARNDAAQVA